MSYEFKISFVETPKAICELMISLISKGKDALILDAGCGRGAFLEVLEAEGYKNVEGIELNKELAEYCRRRFKNYKIINEDYLIFKPTTNYDVIIGNPPYAHFNSLPRFIRKRVTAITGSKECDIYYAFILKSISLLKKGGELIFITPYGFTYNTYAFKVRKALSNSIQLFIDLDEIHLFQGENPEPVIFKYIKGIKIRNMKVLRLKMRNISIYDVKKFALQTIKQKKSNKVFDYFEREPFAYSEKIWTSFPKIAFKKSLKLKRLAKVCVGFVSGFDKAFLLENENYFFSEKERKFIKPFIKAKNCRGYWTEGKVYYIVTDDINEEKELEELPNIKIRLNKYRSLMKRRYLPFKKKWFQWQALRNREKIEQNLLGPKIFVPTLDRSKTNRFSLSYEPVFPSGDVLVLLPKPGWEFFLLGYLNSYFFRQFYLSNGGKRGGRIAFTQRLLSEIEIPLFDRETREKIAILAEKIYKEKNLKYREEIENLIRKSITINLIRHKTTLSDYLKD